MDLKSLFYPMHPPIKGARRVVQQEGKNPKAEYQRAYYLANKEKIRAKQREYYQANKETIKKAVNEYKREHPEKVRGWKRSSERYRLKQRGTIANPD
jgi:hypothetical protein